MEEKVISRVYDALEWWRAANLVNLLIVRAADCSHCLTFMQMAVFIKLSPYRKEIESKLQLNVLYSQRMAAILF